MTLKIGTHKIGENRVFVIAEIGNNHEGSFKIAKNIVSLILI